MTTKRIKKKRYLNRRADELRDFIGGIRRSYSFQRLRELEQMNLGFVPHMSRYKAKRMIRQHDKTEREKRWSYISALMKNAGPIEYRFVSGVDPLFIYEDTPRENSLKDNQEQLSLDP